MDTKFTKGPWSQSHRKVKSGGYSTQVYDQNGETICTVDWYVIPTENGFTTNRDENARLIACAPDMYEILEKIHESMAGNGEYGEFYYDVKELLKRARGE